MPEPGNGSVLYWPPRRDSDDNYITGLIAIRDDAAPNSQGAAAHWYEYGVGNDGDPMTWADLWEWGHQYGAPVDEARVIPAAPAGPTPTEMVPVRRGADLYGYMHACGHVEWLLPIPERT